jgi:hypothetical protein
MSTNIVSSSTSLVTFAHILSFSASLSQENTRFQSEIERFTQFFPVSDKICSTCSLFKSRKLSHLWTSLWLKVLSTFLHQYNHEHCFTLDPLSTKISWSKAIDLVRPGATHAKEVLSLILRCLILSASFRRTFLYATYGTVKPSSGAINCCRVDEGHIW